MNFYQQGQFAALEKRGQAGLLGRAVSGIANTARGGAKRVSEGWKGLAPETQSLVGQGVTGGTVGGIVGANDDKYLGGGVGGAALGALGGAGMMMGGRALGQRLLGGAKNTSRGVRATSAKAVPAPAAPAATSAKAVPAPAAPAAPAATSAKAVPAPAATSAKAVPAPAASKETAMKQRGMGSEPPATPLSRRVDRRMRVDQQMRRQDVDAILAADRTKQVARKAKIMQAAKAAPKPDASQTAQEWGRSAEGQNVIRQNLEQALRRGKQLRGPDLAMAQSMGLA